MYDSEHRMFRIIFFGNNGPCSEEGNQYAGEVADGKLTTQGPARFQYDLDEHPNQPRQHNLGVLVAAG